MSITSESGSHLIAGTLVVLLGTGTPNADPERSGPAVAVVVNDRAYLVDFGPGVVRRAAAAAKQGIATLSPERIATAFLTHLHSDHTTGYADLILTPWVLGRSAPLQVYGPSGLRDMTDHLLAAYRADIRERIDGLAPHLVTQRGIAYVPENRRLFPRLSVADNLRLGSYLFRKEADREAPMATVMRLFPRLGERLEQRAETLSGGEQQMLAISRALMTRPKLLMLDEPSQGIMPKLVDEIFVAVSAIREAGTTVLIVEQRLTECLEIADRAYVLQTGRVTMSGTAAEISGNAEVRKAYLGL